MEAWRRYAEKMVSTQIYPRGIDNSKILEAMRNVPRHMFIPAEYRSLSYSDCAVPINLGQTISQPYIVARMTDLLTRDLAGDAHILEIGTGSGYQAAVLAQMGMTVNSIERIEALGIRARQVLQDLGYPVRVMVLDGRKGYEEGSPYEGIIVTAASEKVELPWLEQLGEGGRLVVPLRIKPGLEQLLVREKKGSGHVDTWYDYCTFVPLLKGVISDNEKPS